MELALQWFRDVKEQIGVGAVRASHRGKDITSRSASLFIRT
jgi:hypothetical protein